MYGEVFKTRYNVMNVSSFHAFTNIKGGVNGNCKDVYFVRMTGLHPTYTEEVRQMDTTLSERMAKGECRYTRINALPRLVSVEDVAYYAGCYDNWQASGKKAVQIHLTENNGDLEEVLGQACIKTAALFAQATPHANDSIIKNFITKLLFWLDQTSEGLLKDWNPKRSLKLAAANLSKKQEYLYAYLLTQMGIDVLLLQYQSDIDASLEQMKLSAKVELGSFGTCTLPEFDPKKRPEEKTEAKKVVITTRPQKPSGSPSPAPLPGRRPQPAGHARRELEFEELARLASSVVMITVHDPKGEVLGTGSGIMVGKEGYILTNHHVASGGRYYSVRIEDDETIYKTDEVIKYNSVLDLSVIRIDRRLSPIPIYQGGKALVRGQKVVAIGSPLGLFNSVSDGIISGFRVVDNVDMIQFTAPTSHGSSGGALLNMYGEVIGISTAGFDNAQNINLAVGYEAISQFIKGFV
ncbi:MAG: trypsin-like serine protease [Lachnospiraceae bacterium]|jgi:serine protease Do|nr:trypsin-like serine protease [Lachnospiraceae bacterium]